MPFVDEEVAKRAQRGSRPRSGSVTAEAEERRKKRMNQQRRQALQSGGRVDPSVAVPVVQDEPIRPSAGEVGTQTPPIYVPPPTTRPREFTDLSQGRPVVIEEPGTQTPPIRPLPPEQVGRPVVRPAERVQAALADPGVAEMVRQNMTPDVLERLRALPSAEDRAAALETFVMSLRRRQALQEARVV